MDSLIATPVPAVTFPATTGQLSLRRALVLLGLVARLDLARQKVT